MADERIVAVGLLTQSNLDALGPSFSRAWPVDEEPCFMGLLREIDEADRALWREPDSNQMRPTQPINE
jgi:hypothetical protein